MLIGLLFPMLPFSLLAQDTKYFNVRGRVLEEQTGQPLPGANVFLAGSTLGSASLTDGSFSFPVPKGMLSYEIAVSIIGFNTVTRVLSEPDLMAEELLFQLAGVTYSLEGITITDSNKEWLKSLERFRRLVFSTTDNSERCSIINPEKLSITFDQVSQEISASSNEPFRFKNEALGYVVELHQAKFFGSETTVKWEGSLHFEELLPRNAAEERKWKSSRRSAYLGSARHFLVSLAEGTTTQNGFFVDTTDRPGLSIEHEVSPNLADYVSVEIADPSIPTWRIHFPRTLAIYYENEPESKAYRKYHDEMGLRERSELEWQVGNLITRSTQNSWLSLSGDYAIIDQFGNEYGAYQLKRFGYWEWERLCEILPSDYSVK